MEGKAWRHLFWLLFLFCLVDARDVYWRASESGLWSRPENWSDGRPPADGDRVWITKSGECVVTLDEIVTIESLTLGSSQGRPVFDATLPLYVRQLEHEFHGQNVNVDGQMYSCGSCTMNTSHVEVAKDAIFEVWWYDWPLSDGKNTSDEVLSHFLVDSILGPVIGSEEISITVPSQSQHYVLTKEEQQWYVSAVAKELSLIGGGATAVFGKGFWVSPVSGLVEEDIVVVTTYCQMLSSLSQECVLLRVNGQSFLMPPMQERSDK